MKSKYDVFTAFGIDNLPLVKELRTKVFIDEQGFFNEFDDIDKTALHLLIKDGDTVAAVARAYTDENFDTWHLGRICVDKKYRKTGLGKILMSELEKAVLNQGGKKAVLSAQVQARGFYEKCGYSAFGEVYLDEHCPHIDMEKTIL